MQDVTKTSTWKVARYRKPRSSFTSESEPIGAPFTVSVSAGDHKRTTERLIRAGRAHRRGRSVAERNSEDSQEKSYETQRPGKESHWQWTERGIIIVG